ncbi:monoheme cytochrome C [Arenibacter sp. GZD96]|uniref:hypothetical protein n=1 Tax=Aurantibrevibacter litoralis TaxID=3106030 RepID=UPI002AFEF1EA|nr:hypothetical protein [Arenibacter sp. GZD-96]MEA1786365.1 monoheme cytochrome C [Arenibacter sp. GZD-96]
MRRNPKNTYFIGFYRTLIVLCALVVIISIVLLYMNFEVDSKNESYNAIEDSATIANEDPNRIENGIHVRTGLVEAPGLSEVVNNCTTCHSAQLVIQNKMSAERWAATIRWMQETQNLWDLGANEDIIIHYLVTNYPPEEKGRRAALTDIQWYTLRN